MIKLGVCGLGRMGSYHLSIYERLMDEGFGVEVKAICDVERDALDGKTKATVNLAGERHVAKREYNKYLSLAEMLEKEELDAVDIVVPTFLHSECAVQVLGHGLHCMCEKPMALDEAQCRAMTQAAEKSGKNLMIGHCLRFWREYRWLYDVIRSKTYGDVLAAYFERGGFADHVNNPSWHNWIIDASRGGGALFDQHIHDTDFILWAFGEPDAVEVHAKKYFPSSKNDIVSAAYSYPDKVVTAIDDISYCALPFEYGYTVNMREATVRFRSGVLTVYPRGGTAFNPDLSAYGDGDAYYNEIKYFLTCAQNGVKPTECDMYDSMKTVNYARLEERSVR